ncbi:MAG TPA: hypothetical protein VK465_18395 [Fibrobacteria bacterium]|nr:hypothetical protein [Fibrobacteria bacterium]
MRGVLFQILTPDVVYPNDAGERLVFRSSARELTLFYLFWKDLGTCLAVALDGVALDSLTSHFPQDWGRGYLRPRQVYCDAE